MIVRLSTVYGNNNIDAVLGPCIENKTYVVVLSGGIYLALWMRNLWSPRPRPPPPPC